MLASDEADIVGACCYIESCMASTSVRSSSIVCWDSKLHEFVSLAAGREDNVIGGAGADERSRDKRSREHAPAAAADDDAQH